MKRHIIPMALVLAIIFALGSMSMSYSQEDYMHFIGCDYEDNEAAGEDVASVGATIVNNKELEITVYNAYPGYVAEVNFTVKHTGETGGPVMYLTYIGDYSSAEMDVVVTDLDGDPIPLYSNYDPGDLLEGLITISVYQPAEQGHSYSFNFDLEFSPGA